ncbi:Nif3-like dinuclear metal center hexameric protein [Gryllotalpicola ginsengisoli]|uniref:Nif3-like dinuclear metal center hexameric protein n=1 Tax=Gryllotalpicola ginsengisoli TaxID=444608 RepID=UPI0003B62F42|nr:Nif3-like dinuclear metal center hexameric protein [Gryllotalpicola ginsengisoli]
MPYPLAEVLSVTEKLWPVAGAEGWDAPGLVTGSPDQQVSSIHLVVDAVAESLDEAVAAGADLVIAHHPLLLRGVTSVAETQYKGAAVATLIRAGVALLSAHTNADVVADGTSAVFARKLGLESLRPIVPGAADGTGIGRVGTLAKATTLGRLARQVAELLPPTAGGVRVAGSYELPVREIALCGGAGDAYLAEPAVRAADVYITSDLRHHPASEAREQHLRGAGPALIDVSHWASEWLWLETAADQLRGALPEASVTVSELRTDPWDFAVVQ